MSAVWLACCNLDDYELVRREVERRDSAARLLRVGRLEELLSVAEALPCAKDGAVLWLRGVSTDLLSAATQALSSGCERRIIVGVEALDPVTILRCLEAGATEVVAMDDAEVGAGRDVWACLDGRRPVTRFGSSGPDDGEASVSSRGPGRQKESGEDRRVGGSDGGRAQAPIDEGANEFDDLGEPPWDEYVEVLDARERCDDAFPGAGRLEFSDRPEGDARGDVRRGGTAQDDAVRSPEQTGRLDGAKAVDCPGDARPSDEGARRGTADGAASLKESGDHHPSGGGEPAGVAPVIVGLSGRGGCGLTTLMAAMAYTASQLGLRTAVLDLDLMFGDVYVMLGAEAHHDLAMLSQTDHGRLTEDEVVRASMRIGPNLTLWGPVAVPEQAEAMGPAVEELIDVLRREADVIFVDTSTHWSDPVAAAVSVADRCLMVGDASVATADSLSRVIELAGRVGVPRTRMTSVFCRFGSAGCGEDAAMRFEVSVALSSRARVADGGVEVRELASFGRIDEAVAKPGAFADSIQALTRDVLRELGCAVKGAPAAPPAPEKRQRLQLPWHKVAGDAR